jgi:hypothetical protein
MKRTILTFALAVSAAAVAPAARAQLPDEAWWQQGEATLGLHVAGRSFCGISAAPQGVWVLRGRVVDGRLVETDRRMVRARSAAHEPAEPPEDTDYFVQPTALVQRDRSAGRPRGEFAVLEPLPAAPNSTLWLDMVWGCSRETELEKLAESPRGADGGR